jgi:DNA invertase Pin-like site-specific DNA recombinase
MYDNFFQLVHQFQIIIYARLSKEEKGKSKEEQSKSIKNQIEICKHYILDEQKNYLDCSFKIVAILTDDGISGTTFERKAYKKLIRLIEEQKANMVITTDLSRLGRNHIQTDDYIEKWFPEHNVRYVSIVEGVDTYTDCMSNDIAPIINWSNEHFAKLTSKKIKGRFLLLRREGKWTGGEPPFGYQIDPKNRYHFIIDLTNALLVKRIFSLFLSGLTPLDIAIIFTNEGIPVPTILKQRKRKIKPDFLEFWSEDTIRHILENEMYIGNMVQGKTTRLNHKSKKIVYLPKENWIIVKNTHEAIIEEEVFTATQQILKTKKNKIRKTHDYLLKGLMICSSCGHRIGIQHFKERSKNYTICNYYRKYGKRKNVCTAHRFVYEELEKMVLQNIEEICFKYVSQKRLTQVLIKRLNLEEPKKMLFQKKLEYEGKIQKLKVKMDEIYNDKLNGLINPEQYQRFVKLKEEELNNYKTKIDILMQEIEAQTNKKKNIKAKHLIHDFFSFKLKRNILITSLIHKIIVHENGNIEIFYKFRNPKIS